MFVVDALDECTSEPELTDLILSLAQALHDPDLPVTHILFTSCSETHISEVFQNEEVRPLLCEIPVKTSGEGVAYIILLDSADVNTDIYIFLQHSFTKLASCHPDFPQPTREELEQLASRAGRCFIIASTMVNFIIDNKDKDPHNQLQLMLKLMSELLPGTEVYKLYDCILSTCTDPEWAYMHLSIVAALIDPLPISQILSLLGPGLGRDVQTMLIQLRSVIYIPTDSTLSINIYHSSIHNYVSDPSHCSLPQICEHNMASPHSLLAESSFHFMMKNIPETMALLDALSELGGQSQVMQAQDPHHASPEVPDREIIHAMNAFITFAKEAQKQSQSSSDAVKYTHQNWVVHLSHAPNPWDNTFKHIFQAFWNHHLLSWLEQQWCLKGLWSCLDILSEAQKLAKVITMLQV
jgi:hypothetical protein